MQINSNYLGTCLLVCAVLGPVPSVASICGVDGPTGFELPTVSTEVHAPGLIKAELELWMEQIRDTHPRLDLVIDYEELLTVKNRILEQVTGPMTQLEIFRSFSQLNPVFSDAHQGTMLPASKDQIAKAIEAGDRLFPLSVHINKDFQLVLKSPYGGMEAGVVIHSINGIVATEITKHLERRARGDNIDFRRNLVADRFAELLWQHFGSSDTFVLGTKTAGGCELITVDGSSELLPHRRAVQDFDKQFSFELLANNQVAYLRADTFFLPDGYDKWFAFSESVFDKLKEAGSQHLVIDIRRNGGGDDALWIEGIMPYIANKRWQRMSHFLGRVRDTDEAFPGRVGEVAIFDYKGEYEVSERLMFDGQVYVITGHNTYSSAIMFATVIKDNQLGKIVGEKILARGCSTGMPKYHEMKTSGLLAFTPQHWYQRNTEESCMNGVELDIPLSDSPFDERELVNSLVNRITAG